MATDRNIDCYFEYASAGVEVEADGLKEMPFGEFLIDQGLLTRAELLCALWEQEKNPGVPLGEIIAWLGYLPYPEIDRLLTEWSRLPVVEVV